MEDHSIKADIMMKRLSLIPAALLLAAVLVLPASAQDYTTAEEVLKAHIEATGGQAAWEAVDDLYVEAEIVAATPMGDLTLKMEMWSIFPGYGLTEMALASGPDGIPAEAVNMKAYYTPLGGWIEQGGQRQDMSAVNPQLRQQFQRQSPKSELELLTSADAELALKESESYSDRDVYVVSVTQNGFEQDMLIDQETLLILAQRASTPMGDVMTVMGEYVEVDGLLFATGQSAETPQGSQSVTFKKFEVNKGLKPATLASKAGVTTLATPE